MKLEKRNIIVSGVIIDGRQDKEKARHKSRIKE